MKLARTLALLAALALAAPAATRASDTQDSTFQDDNHLVYAAPDQVAATLDELRSLGVDRVRVSLFWRLVAPAPDQALRPDFDDTNPAQYPPGAWDRYDTIVRDAAQRGIGVIFDVTGPAPDWATGTSPDRPDIKATYDPNPLYFDAFVRAAGTRYSGTYDPGGGALPRVSTWGIWNEPNQAGWLTPQWAPAPGGRQMIPASPRIYRSLVGAAWDGLQSTGHGADTILIGETAPKGLLNLTGETRSIDPVVFIEELYCLDRHLQLYAGQAAADRGCPQSDQVDQFAAQNPALFNASGWAHHPYELIFSPGTPPRHRDRWITTGNLGSLSRLLRRIRARYRQPARPVPLWLTEFGYQTHPPDPLGVSFARQAVYLDQAEYIAWRNRNVQTLTQFLLYDDGPPYGLTFQSGLRTQDGTEKPSYAAYRLPLWLPRARVRRGTRMEVWGLVRPAPNGTAVRVAIDVRRRGARRWHTLAEAMTDAQRNYLDRRVRITLRRGRYLLRLRWAGLASRSTPFTVR